MALQFLRDAPNVPENFVDQITEKFVAPYEHLEGVQLVPAEHANYPKDLMCSVAIDAVHSDFESNAVELWRRAAVSIVASLDGRALVEYVTLNALSLSNFRTSFASGTVVDDADNLQFDLDANDCYVLRIDYTVGFVGTRRIYTEYLGENLRESLRQVGFTYADIARMDIRHINSPRPGS